MSSYRVVPTQSGPSKASVQDTANSFGLHDTFRYGLRSLSSEIKRDPLQSRLDNWEETQDRLKLTMQRNVFGMHMPVRQMMERKLVASTPHMPALQKFHSNIHLDVLMGRDETLDISDVFSKDHDAPLPLDIHGEMERQRRI